MARIPLESMPASLAPMLEKAVPAVVNISTSSIVLVRRPAFGSLFGGNFFTLPGRRQRQEQSAGSGVILDAIGGYIATNNHVIEGADEIQVKLSDGRTLNATLIGRDAQTDLAVLQVEATDLTEIPVADTSKLAVGDFVVAIGNPFGLGQAVTSGIVSALGRTGVGVEGYEDFIQTDASINPGNSGGALLNLQGELVGINTSIFTPTAVGGNIGIGFAIPSHIVRAVLDQLIRYGEVRRGNVGVQVQALNPSLRETLNLMDGKGVMVVDVDRDSAASEAGLRPLDVILRLGDQQIRDLADYYGKASALMVGDSVEIEYNRDGRTHETSLSIARTAYEEVPGERLSSRFVGAVFQEYRSLGVSNQGPPENPDAPPVSAADTPDELSRGVRVLKVIPGSPAWRYGLRGGDLIFQASNARIRNLSDLTVIARSGRAIRLFLERGSQRGYLDIR